MKPRWVDLFTAPARMEIEVTLPGRRRALVVYPDDLTPADAERVCAVLRTLPMTTKEEGP